MPLPTGPYRESLYVPVRDGTRLAMNIYRPARNGVPVAGPLPVVFAFTPYRSRFHDATGRHVELAAFGVNAPGLLENGYVLAVADIRGKGASFGARRGFQDRTEAMDGHDLVQWLAAQPWSTGKVGMYGCSYLGGTTVHVATTAPPALRAIFTGATDLDKFNFVRNGGITAQFNTRPDEPLSDDLMSVPVDADIDGSELRAAVADHARNTPMAALWYGMPYRDSHSALTGNRYWEEVGPYPYLDDDAKIRSRHLLLEQLGRRAHRAGHAGGGESGQQVADRPGQPLRAATRLRFHRRSAALLRPASQGHA